MSSRNPIIEGGAYAPGIVTILPNLDAQGVGGGRPRGMTGIEALERAKREARVIGEAEGFEKGKLKGFAEGLADGREHGRQEAYNEAERIYREGTQRFLAELESKLSEVQAAIPIWFENSEQAMTDLAMGAVKKLLGAELQISRDSALAIVKESLEQVTHSKTARIRLNPFDCEAIRERKDEILAAAGSLRQIEFISDGSLTGGCVVETDGGVIDASLETRLELMEDSFRRAA